MDIRFHQVSKRYRIPAEASGIRKLLPRYKEFWAVRDVDFEVRRGETVGIIGHNGAGKSTVLKLLSRITAPSSGEIHVAGRVGAMIEVGSGFHPELTGRENIFLSGSILGMRRREITRNLESIVEFAGIGAFLDLPVKRYSSGMFVRLGFSIMAHLHPDILLLDEVLAVGDASFQQKCLARIGELHKSGTTMLFISHDLSLVQRFCERVLVLHRGALVDDAAPREAIERYRRMTNSIVRTPRGDADPRVTATKEIEITEFEICDGDGNVSSSFQTGGPMVAKMKYAAHQPYRNASFHIDFWRDDTLMCNFMTEEGGTVDLDSGSGTVEFFCPEIGLVPGVYEAWIYIKPRGGPRSHNVDAVEAPVVFQVNEGRAVRGEFFVPFSWTVTPGAKGDENQGGSGRYAVRLG